MLLVHQVVIFSMGTDEADEDHLVWVVDDGDDAVAVVVDVEADETVTKWIGRGHAHLDFVRGLPGTGLNDFPPFPKEALGIREPLPELAQGG